MSATRTRYAPEPGRTGAGAAAQGARRYPTGSPTGEPDAPHPGVDQLSGGRPGVIARVVAAFTGVSSRPLLDYFMLISITLLLLVIGLIMVLTSSLSTSAADGNVWAATLTQGTNIVYGLAALWLAMQVPLRWYRALKWVILAVSLGLLVWVLLMGYGRSQVGAQSWFAIGSKNFQPSEAAKIGVGMFGAAFIADGTTLHSKRRRILWFTLIMVVLMGLILLQGDLGMALTFLTVGLIVLIFGGVSIMLVAGLGVGVVAGVGVLMVKGFRSERLDTFLGALHNSFDTTKDATFQSHQAFLSLGEGGVTGVGIGQSKAQWGWLPEAHNDFIFSIIGESTGLVGGVLVIGLYAGLLLFGLRCAMRQSDRFVALLAAVLTCGLVTQAFINISYVVGLLPVTGIQLPLISSGGTSIVVTLASVGVLLSCARHEPETVAAMATRGKPLIDRMLLLREPVAGPTDKAARDLEDTGGSGSWSRRSRGADESAPPRRSRAQRTPAPVASRAGAVSRAGAAAGLTGGGTPAGAPLRGGRARVTPQSSYSRRPRPTSDSAAHIRTARPSDSSSRSGATRSTRNTRSARSSGIEYSDRTGVTDHVDLSERRGYWDR